MELLRPYFQLCLCFLVLTTRQGIADGPQSDGADLFVLAAMKHWAVPGTAIVVVKDGKVVLSNGYGVRERGGGKPVREDTLFDIASCRKSFTAASVAVLVDQEKLRWDDPVSKHLPEIKFPSEFMTRHATLRDLLCHRTGLQRGDLLFSGDELQKGERLGRIRYLKSEAPFRTTISYSNLMYLALQEVVAKVSGRPWPRFVREELLDPLKMQATTFSINEQARCRLAPRHWRHEGKITSRGAPTAGGMYSTVDDMGKWVQFQLALGRCGDRQLISEKSMREMHAMYNSTAIRKRPPDNPYAARFYGAGLGWFIMDYRGRQLVMHTGAWGAIVALVPEENLGVVVLSNLDWNGLTGMLMYRILDSYCAPSKSVWATNDFKQFDSEGPGYAYRDRDRERALLDAARTKETKPSLSVAGYAGSYRSSLYGDIHVSHEGELLSLRIGRFTSKLVHWESNVFYARSPTQLNFDWLVQFEVEDSSVNTITLKYLGWHEPDAVFQRLQQRPPASEHRFP